MQKRSVKLKLGCESIEKTSTITLQLRRKYYDEWTEGDLYTSNILSELITKVIVGPKTVVELYYDPYLYRFMRILKNDSATENLEHNLGCFEDFGTWSGAVRSLRIWDYDTFQKLYGVRYCDNDADCRETEYCLCPQGQRKAEWCPESKRRCLPMSKFMHQRDKMVELDDLVDKQCFNEEIAKYKNKFDNKPVISFRDLRLMASKCSGPDIVFERKYQNGKMDKIMQVVEGGDIEVIESFIANKLNKTCKTDNIIRFILIIMILIILFFFKIDLLNM